MMPAVEVSDSEALSLPCLPWPCLSIVFQSLPLRTILILQTVCKEFRDVVQKDVLRNISSLDLNNFFGAKVAEGLAWAFNADLPALRAISASGHVCVDAVVKACSLPLGQARLHQLTSLHLDSLKQLQDKHLEVVLPQCPNLEVLALPRCVKLADSAASLVGTHLPRLREVCCLDWSGLTDAGVVALATGCPLLEDITLDGCLRVGSESLAVLARSCPRLRRLSIAKSYCVTDTAMAALGEWSGAGLRELCLRQCPRVAGVRLLRRCSGLTSLDLSGCSRVDAVGLSELLAGCGACLTNLQLSGCVGVSGEALAVVGRLCPSLRSLNLRGLALQDGHLQELARTCTSLRSVGLAWCTRVTDKGLAPLVEANPELRDLDLEALYLLSDAVLELLSQRAVPLGRLCIRMCHHLTPAGIVALAAAVDVRSLALSGILDDAGTSDLVSRVRKVRPTCTLHW